jgi:hypothetical protein
MTVGIAATTAMAVGNVAFVELVVVVTVTVEPVCPVRTGKDHQSNLMQCFECRPSQSVCEHCIENPIPRKGIAQPQCSTTGKPTRSFATERVSLDSV